VSWLAGAPLESGAWLLWCEVALLGALLAMDENSFVQTWLSQPLPAAVLAGLVLGEPAAGLLPGALMQLVVIGNLPVGASFRLDPASAAVGVTAGAVLAGWRAPVDLLARSTWSGGPAAELGALLVLFAAASVAGGRLVRLERLARLGWMLDGYRSVRDGDLARLERLHARCLVTTALRGAALALSIAVVVSLVWDPGLALLSPRWRGALALVPLAVPGLAVGTLLDRFGYRRSLALVGIGAAVGFLVATAAGQGVR